MATDTVTALPDEKPDWLDGATEIFLSARHLKAKWDADILDVDDKNKIGTDQGICFRTVPGKTWDAQPGKGQVWPFNHTGDSVFAITGGTGDYAGAQGDMVLSAYGSKGDAYTFIYRLK